jgi:hypothetical protein
MLELGLIVIGLLYLAMAVWAIALLFLRSRPRRRA